MPQMTRNRQRAVDAFAAQLERRGSAYRNTAASVRAGYRNMWIDTALDTLEQVMASVPDDDDEAA